MRIFASLKIAGRALLRNKMRSLLTMLGIINRRRCRHRLGESDFRRHQTGRGPGQQPGRERDSRFFRQFHQRRDARWLGSAPTLTVEDAKAIGGLKNVVAVSPEVATASRCWPTASN